VTNFFRDPDAFEALKTIIYPVMLQGRQTSDTLRVWVPGCSTGEEAYSHAIALLEHVNKVRADVSIQIFGTDLSEEAIRTRIRRRQGQTDLTDEAGAWRNQGVSAVHH
jgi:two-component system CheB/CheR fusion protein